MTNTRLAKFREILQKNQLDFYYVPSSDAHYNEYVPKAWQRRAFMTGFDGSAGDALIGSNQAYLWTDPRYFLQAEQQLDASSFTLMKQQQGLSAPIHEWLAVNASHKKIGIDPKLLTCAQAHLWIKALESQQSTLVCLEENLVDQIWQDQPEIVFQPVVVWNEQYAGFSAKEKIQQLRLALTKEQCNAHIITLLDAVMWLYNIRGSDVDHNPLAISYAMITEEHAYFYIRPHQIDHTTREYLTTQNIIIKNYDDFAKDCQALQGRVWLDDQTASFWVSQQCKAASLYFAPSPITMMKAIKNPTECQGMHEAHRKDALAVCRFLAYLEQNWQGKTELDVDIELTKMRQRDPDLRGLSFTTIAGYKDHGAIIHYRATEETAHTLGDQALLLIDSGGQYLQGTTDITRTVHLGTPSANEKRDYTLVLKGHLALRHTAFPHGITGEQLNAIAHRPLWNQFVDFGHGTGHGVGCYLCVHEGPQRIGNAYTRVPLLPGMIVSNEPGLYLNGEYGIRIENLCLVILLAEDGATHHGPFYGFEDLTKVPYARNLIEQSLLTPEEIAQINAYHQSVYALLAKDLEPDVQQWLEKATKPL